MDIDLPSRRAAVGDRPGGRDRRGADGGGVHSAKAKGERIEVHCKGCGKKPSELEEYISAAQDNNMTPDDYVVQEEGTYNHNTGEFWCTSCYVKAGCPLGKA